MARRRTRVSSSITKLPEAVRDQLDAMLLDTANSYDDIVAWLAGQGYTISRSAVGRYAIRANQATQRITETLEKTKLIAAAVEQNPEADYSKASRMLMLDGLMQRVSTAEDEFDELPLDKAGRLIAQLSRVEVYEQQARRGYKTKAQQALDALEDDLMRAIKADPELSVELHRVLAKARERLLTDD